MDNGHGSVFTPAKIRRLRDRSRYETELDVYFDEINRAATADTPDRFLMFGIAALIVGTVGIYQNGLVWWPPLLLAGGALAVAGGAGAMLFRRANVKRYEQGIEMIRQKLNAEQAEG